MNIISLQLHPSNIFNMIPATKVFELHKLISMSHQTNLNKVYGVQKKVRKANVKVHCVKGRFTELTLVVLALCA